MDIDFFGENIDLDIDFDIDFNIDFLLDFFIFFGWPTFLLKWMILCFLKGQLLRFGSVLHVHCLFAVFGSKPSPWHLCCCSF